MNPFYFMIFIPVSIPALRPVVKFELLYHSAITLTDSLSLENFFKGWLRDASTDVEHLHLIMSSEPGIVCYLPFILR